MTNPRPLGKYGVDAPWVPWLWLGYAVLYGAVSVLSITVWDAWWWVTALSIAMTVCSVVGAALFWNASISGKFVIWDALLGGRSLATGAAVLDLGCGHGMVAVMTALRFPSASVVGIDLWRSRDQSGNTPEAARANAKVNAVADRVRFDTGDMIELPYPTGYFDLVTASLSVHNIPSRSGRQKAIAEAVRVLAPGGTVLIADIRRTPEYCEDLRAAGFDVSVRPAGWRGWWSGPWMRTTILEAVAPPAAG